MVNLSSKIGFIALSAVLMMCTSCNDSESTTVPPPSESGGPITLKLVTASVRAFGAAEQAGCDRYRLFLSNGIAMESEGSFIGAGKGICFELYASTATGQTFPSGTFGMHPEGAADWLNTFAAGSPGQGSYFYPGADAETVYVTDGSLTIESTGSDYRVTGVVTCSDASDYSFSYTGPISVKADEPDEPDEPDQPDPVTVSYSGGIYLGTLMNDAYDNFSLYFMTEGVDDTNMSFSGVGKGFYLDMYVPIAGKTTIPAGTYNLSNEAGAFAFLPGEDLGGMVSGSFVYSFDEGDDPDSRYIPITGGSVTISKSTYVYTVTADVSCGDGKDYQFVYEGTIFSILDPMGSVEYTEVSKSGGYYFGTMMNENYDNYSYYICSEDVTESNFSFDGTGMAISFDMYAPLGTGVVPAEGTYTVYSEQTDDTLAFKYMPGEDYGSGMLTGSYIWKRESGDADKTYVYILGGTMTISKSEDIYTTAVHLFGNDGEEYNYRYSGSSLNVLDPTSGM